jgi:hypothetical protein
MVRADLGGAVGVVVCMIAGDIANLLCCALVVGVAALTIRVSIGVAVDTFGEVSAFPGVMSLVLARLAFFFSHLLLLFPIIGEVVEAFIVDQFRELLGVRQVVEDFRFNASIGIGGGEMGEAGADILASPKKGFPSFSEFYGTSLHLAAV